MMTTEEHVRAALRRLSPDLHTSDISWPSLNKIVRVVAAAEKFIAAYEGEPADVFPALDELDAAVKDNN